MSNWTNWAIVAGYAFGLTACQGDPSKAGASPPHTTDSPIERKLAQYTTVRLTADLDKLTASERQMIPLLIDAARSMDTIYWRQAYGNRDSLLKSIQDPGTRRYAEINYGPWDRLDGNAPFIEGVGPKPKGAAFYPNDMTKEEFEAAAAKVSGAGQGATEPVYDRLSRHGWHVDRHAIPPEIRRPDTSGRSKATAGCSCCACAATGRRKCALDIALHDLAGRILGIPVHRLLDLPVATCRRPTSPSASTSRRSSPSGPGVRRTSRRSRSSAVARRTSRRSRRCAPSTTGRSGSMPTPAGRRESAATLLPAMARPGRRAHRAAVPARAPTASSAGSRSASALPIVADESAVFEEDLDALEGVVAGVNVKLAKVGGIGPARSMLEAARERGFRTFLGCMEETSVGIAASAVVASLADWVDLDGNLLLADDPFSGLELGPDKRWRLAEAPGLGLTRRDDRRLTRRTVARTARVFGERPFMWTSSWMKWWTSPLSVGTRPRPTMAADRSTTPRQSHATSSGPAGTTRSGGRRGATDGPSPVSPCTPSAHAIPSGVGHARPEGRARHRWIPAPPPRESPTRTRSSSSDSATAADAWAGRSSMTRCAPSPVAGLFRGYGPDDLADHGIGFGLFDMPALAAIAREIVAEEQARRRPVTVVLAPVAADAVGPTRSSPTRSSPPSPCRPPSNPSSPSASRSHAPRRTRAAAEPSASFRSWSRGHRLTPIASRTHREAPPARRRRGFLCLPTCVAARIKRAPCGSKGSKAMTFVLHQPAVGDARSIDCKPRRHRLGHFARRPTSVMPPSVIRSEPRLTRRPAFMPLAASGSGRSRSTQSG